MEILVVERDGRQGHRAVAKLRTGFESSTNLVIREPGHKLVAAPCFRSCLVVSLEELQEFGAVVVLDGFTKHNLTAIPTHEASIMLNDKNKKTVRSVLQSHLHSDVSRNLIDCIRSASRTPDNSRLLAWFLVDVLCRLLCLDAKGILFFELYDELSLGEVTPSNHSAFLLYATQLALTGELPFV
jgi:hypothetical protein